jgi:hypothetical protein
MSKITGIFGWVLAICLLSSCGVITKTRYGNGLKLNLGLNVFRNEKSIKADRESKRPGKVLNGAFRREKVEIPASATVIFTESPVPEALSSPGLQSKARVPAVIRNKYREIRKQLKKGSSPNTGNNNGMPLEPNTLAAGILFYGGLIGYIVMTYNLFIVPPLMPTLCSIAMLVGFILAIVGLRKIRNSDEYSGYGLAISILVVAGLIVLAFLAIIAFFILFFGVI